MASLPFKSGTKAQFDSLPIKDENVIYWLTDTQELYRGNILYGVGREASEFQSGLMSAEDKQTLNRIKEQYFGCDQNYGIALAENEGNLKVGMIPAMTDIYNISPMMADIPTTTEEQIPAYDPLNDLSRYDSKYPRFPRYEDNAYSSINKNKDIIIDNGQINITEENNSQFIPFEMQRFHDGVDLSLMTLKLLYVRSDNKQGEGKIVNVEYLPDTIKFAWLVDEKVTAVVGPISFELNAIGYFTNLNGEYLNSKGEVIKNYVPSDESSNIDDENEEVDNDSLPMPYLWKSKIGGGINVIKSLFSTGNIEIDENWQTELVKDVAIVVTETYVEQQWKKFWEGENGEDGCKAQVESEIDSLIDNYVESFQYIIDEKINDAVENGLANFNNYVDKDTHILHMYVSGATFQV